MYFEENENNLKILYNPKEIIHNIFGPYKYNERKCKHNMKSILLCKKVVKVKVKINLSQCLITHHTNQTYLLI
jgi:hypothetical protein